MPGKAKPTSKFGQQNWLGEANQPRYMTKYTIPGVLYLVGGRLARGLELLIYLLTIMTVAQWFFEATGLFTYENPLSLADWVLAGAGLLLFVVRCYLRRPKKK